MWSHREALPVSGLQTVQLVRINPAGSSAESRLTPAGMLRVRPKHPGYPWLLGGLELCNYGEVKKRRRQTATREQKWNETKHTHTHTGAVSLPAPS